MTAGDGQHGFAARIQNIAEMYVMTLKPKT